MGFQLQNNARIHSNCLQRKYKKKRPGHDPSKPLPFPVEDSPLAENIPVVSNLHTERVVICIEPFFFVSEQYYITGISAPLGLPKPRPALKLHQLPSRTPPETKQIQIVKKQQFT